MSLGFGQVTPDQWNKAKKGGDADEVPVGDYRVNFVRFREIDGSRNDKGLHTIILTFETTSDNKKEFQDKTLEFRGMYHPNPPASVNPEGFAKMNEITQQNLVQLIDRAEMEPVETPEGSLDIFASLKQLSAMKPEMMVAVTHRTYDGKTFQDVGKFRPVA